MKIENAHAPKCRQSEWTKNSLWSFNHMRLDVVIIFKYKNERRRAMAIILRSNFASSYDYLIDGGIQEIFHDIRRKWINKMSTLYWLVSSFSNVV